MRRSGVATSTLLLALFLLQALFRQPARASAPDGKVGRNPRRRRQSSSSCNLFQGTWVPDPSYPFYSSSACPFIDSEFDCIKYGRPDTDFLKFSWKPAACSIPRFDGGAFARRWAGKKIMLVGDSLSLNMWESLLCMIHASAPDLQYVLSRKEPVSFVRFTGGPTVFFYHTPYLVDVVRDRRYGRLLKLDSIQAGNSWKGMDMLIFNSWHWWTHRGKSQPWDYVDDGTKVVKDMDRLDAFYLGMSTWARWVDGNVDVSETKVFFQGISPTHYMGKEWNKARGSCSGETVPLPAAAYPAGTPAAVGVVNRVLAGMRRPAYLLDITLLSQLRKDAHPSGYSGGHPDMDCSHWCLPGLPDTWNQLLYAALATM